METWKYQNWLAMLCDAFGKNMQEKQAVIWVERLERAGYSSDTLEAAENEIITQHTKFPSLSELLSVLTKYHAAGPERESISGCKHCSHGLVCVAYKAEDGRWYKKIYRCKCSGGQKYAAIQCITESEFKYKINSGEYFREFGESGDYVNSEYLESKQGKFSAEIRKEIAS